MFDSHHGVIAKMLPDQVAFLDQRIKEMEDQAVAALAEVKESWGVDATGETGPGRGAGPDSLVLAAAYRLAEIPGISVWLAIVIIAESGSLGASPRQGPLRPESMSKLATRRRSSARLGILPGIIEPCSAG